jgi:hypothetical protein
METWRRGILLACLVLALGSAKWAVLRPLLSLERLDFSTVQGRERAWSEEGARLKALPPDATIAEKTRDKTVEVSGPEWAALFAGLRAADANEPAAGAWLDRAPADERRWGFTGKWYFFRPDESPVREVAARLTRNADRVYVRWPGPTSEYLQAELHLFSNDDFQFGSGFSHMPKPPARFLFPYRRFSGWIALLGLAVYVFLPRRRREKDAVAYPAWRIILSDFASFLLIGPFLALPLFIVGGTVQAVLRGWMLCLIFWPLGLLGVWLLRIVAGYAGYEILLRPEGLFIRDGRREESVPFASLRHYRPLDLRPPRWLVRAGWLAALAGHGAARAGAAGRALLLSGFSNGGLGLGRRDGSSVFIWVTDAMGSAALKNAGKMLKALDKAGVPRLDEVQEIRSVAPPTGQDAAGRILKEGSETVVWILAGLPVAAMIIFFLLAMFGRAF